MAAYLRFYQFDASPFESSNDKRAMVLGTRSLRGAFEQVKNGLEEDSPRICLSGSGGVGKTSFCRALPRLLGDSAKVALVVNPRRPWREIRDTIAKKFDLVGGAISRKALLEAGGDSQHLVLVIDDAELLSHESLDHLDILLQYKRDDGTQLLHCIMLANLDSASTGVEIPLLWWLDKLTTLQLQFSPIPIEGLRHYVEKHLAKAGWAGGELFTEDALEAIHRNTGGLPRAINQLCEKILMEGGARGITSISAQFIEELCGVPAEPEIERPQVSNPDMSADFSIGDFGTSPSAQQLLDAAPREDVSYEEERIAPDSEYLQNRPPELQSLILNQDSDEALHVESAPAVETPGLKQHSLTIELEDDPAERAPLAEFHASRSVNPAVARNRSASTGRAQRGYGGKLVFAAIIVAAAYWVNAQFSSPADLINRAEVKITNALDRKSAADTTVETETPLGLEEIEIAEAEPRQSLIDRADEIAAETGLDSIPLPEVNEDLVELGQSGDAIEGAEFADAMPEIEPTKAAVIPALKPAPTVTTKKSVEPNEIAQTLPTTTEAKASKAAVVKSKSTAKVSDELVVINEYTAIPEAAASAPKLAIPGTAKTEPDVPRPKVALDVTAEEPKDETITSAAQKETETVPAMIDPETRVEEATSNEEPVPTRASDQPTAEAQPSEPGAEPTLAPRTELEPISEPESPPTADLP